MRTTFFVWRGRRCAVVFLYLIADNVIPARYSPLSPLDSCPSGPILFVAMTTTFRIGVTRDFLKDDGTLGFGDIGLDLLDESPKVEWEFLAENTTELRPDQIRGYDSLLALASIVSAETLHTEAGQLG